MDEKKIIILEHDSEADTCRKEVTPKLYASEWTDEQILEQRVFTAGKIVVLGKGTGKTSVAFQIIYKLWNNRWNNTGEHRRPKVLFLADRKILVDDPYAKDFAVFGDARASVFDDGATTSREIYFSTYQSLAESESREGVFRQFPRTFFDLIVVDECHRGSATDEGNWRRILDYFTDAVKLGMTATPLRHDNVDTYAYFGNPIYTYSLRQGIEDGYLAPYIVRRIVTDVDATGWRPQAGQTDMYGNVIPDDVYMTPDFEKSLSLLSRTKAVARHLTEHLKKYGRLDKTIIFCHDQEHADQMRRELGNLNADLVKQNPNYVVRIVSDEGDWGKRLLGNFMDIEQDFPVIVTTSQLLSTGVDVQTCKNIVLFRMVNSMTEFKQIIGRGTRVREDKDKLFFTILDYTGSATRNFADPDFDGEPPLITEESLNQDLGGLGDERIIQQLDYREEGFSEEEIRQILESQNPQNPGSDNLPRKYYVKEGEVSIVAESVQVLDVDGKLRTVEFTQYAKEQVTTLYTDAGSFRAAWADPEQRQGIVTELESRGISLEQLSDITNLKDADPFDMLCFVAYDLKPMTRRERAERVRKAAAFAAYTNGAREVIDLILDKYIQFGANELNAGILEVKPISDKGNVVEIAAMFGGAPNLLNALDELQKLLYAEAA